MEVESVLKAAVLAAYNYDEGPDYALRILKDISQDLEAGRFLSRESIESIIEIDREADRLTEEDPAYKLVKEMISSRRTA
jgi:hypothetical protein